MMIVEYSKLPLLLHYDMMATMKLKWSHLDTEQPNKEEDVEPWVLMEILGWILEPIKGINVEAMDGSEVELGLSDGQAVS